ncbi:hypothetical protein FIBSPDRAFT_294746 [Athelia psychrophila]|uniref:Uncharacterized protein n=1 Tax=Athelia psychrophila TaxID=1759441 RepID=A0A167XDC9_9AGAM|nr:hypothetical protein FIBSPDRAFT_294746 [Fibularhizoctonia sp. CBS 109695]
MSDPTMPQFPSEHSISRLGSNSSITAGGSNSVDPSISEVDKALHIYLGITALPVIQPDPKAQDYCPVVLGILAFSGRTDWCFPLTKGRQVRQLLSDCLSCDKRWLQFLGDRFCRYKTKYDPQMILAAAIYLVSGSRVICLKMVATPGVITILTRY